MQPIPKKPTGKGVATPKQTAGKEVATPKQKKQRPRSGHIAHQGRMCCTLDDIPDISTFAPPGWIENKPALPNYANTLSVAQCADVRYRLLEWVASGLDAAQAEDDADPSTPTYPTCWKGRIVDIHRRAVDTADSVIGVAGDAAEMCGYILEQPTRGAVGLDEDSDMRVLGVWCQHNSCQSDNNRSVLEMRWLVGNAALESEVAWEEDDGCFGFLTPGTALAGELRRHGVPDDADQNNPVYGAVISSLKTRLGIGADYRHHKPIDTRRMIRDEGGNLLAVRPRPRPRPGDAERYLRDRPRGVTTKEMADRFGVSPATIKRVIDDLNPEFVARGIADRCIHQRRGGQQLWSITDDEPSITAYVRKFGRMGREYDILLKYRTGRYGEPGYMGNTGPIRRW